MSEVRIERHRATVVVRPDVFSHDTYSAQSVTDLEAAVIGACRAINTTASQDLIARIVGEQKPPNPPAAAR